MNVRLFRLSKWYVAFEHLQQKNVQGNQLATQKAQNPAKCVDKL